MSQTVLVIDSNSAVQAITTLALNQTDCTVETLADGAQAYQKIRSLKPNVVLCAKELTGLDPFELCRKIKAENSATAFVLLAPADALLQTAALAEEADFDEVIYKPFKSNRLREVVTALIQKQSTAVAAVPTFYVMLQDNLRRKIVERFLSKHGCQVLAEFQPELAASTFVILEASAKLPKGVRPAHAYKLGDDIASPLTTESLTKVFAPHLTVAPVKSAVMPASHEHSASDVAAEIAASIFRRLLSSAAPANKDLTGTAHVIQDELRQIAAKLGW